MSRKPRRPTIPISGAGGGQSRFAGTDPNTRDLLRQAERAEWKIIRTHKGHWKIFPPNPEDHVIIAPGTASCYRGTKNLRADLRRAGLDV